MRLVPFNPVHLAYMDIQDDQSFGKSLLDEKDYQDLLIYGNGRSLLHNGEVMFCGGVFPMTQTIGRSWAMLSKHSGKCLRFLTRETIKFHMAQPFDRIETPVRRDFLNGHRWVKMLGFKNETPDGMKYYGLKGETYDLYGFYPKEYLKDGKFKSI